MSTITLHEGDNRDSLRRLIAQGVHVHSVVTDPPYGLTSVVKRFGKDNAAPALSNGATGVFKRASGGFMGQEWDASGIERDPEFWRLIWEILLPGGYVLAFSGARTGHWQACAMEQAGFIMHPMIGWTYGSGFPKAHNAAGAVDKALGVEGRREGVKPGHEEFAGRKTTGHIDFKDATEGFDRPWMKDEAKRADYHKNYVPGSPEAAQWEGWAYGAQSLKPAFEPIYMGQKPFSEKNGALNLLKHGVGAVNIDGCRAPTSENLNGGRYANHGPGESDGSVYGSGINTRTPGAYTQPTGRHPANLLHDGSPEVVALFPDSKGQQGRSSDADRSQVHTYGAVSDTGKVYEPRGDSGSAARFFNSFPEPDPDAQQEEIDVSWISEAGPCLVRLLVDTEQSPPKVIAASGSAENSDWNTFLFGNGLTGLCQKAIKFTTETRINSTIESKTWNWLTRSLTSASTEVAGKSQVTGGSLAENVASPSTLTIITKEKTEFLLGASPAASQTPLKISVVGARDSKPLYYHAKATKADRAGSGHPTVKPVKLKEWLVTLVTPPGGTVLDPFGGSGTTGQAAKNLGFDCILMEAEAAYIADIKTRFSLPSNDDCDLFGDEPAFDDLFG